MIVQRLSPALLLLALAAPAPAAEKDAGAKEALANAKARVEAARKVYQGILGNLKVGPPGTVLAGLDLSEQLHRWSLRWMEAQVETSMTKDDRVAAAEAHVARMSSLEKVAAAQHRTGSVAKYTISGAAFYRLEAEKRLRQIKKK